VTCPGSVALPVTRDYARLRGFGQRDRLSASMAEARGEGRSSPSTIRNGAPLSGHRASPA
jgi:hypothetical protein